MTPDEIQQYQNFNAPQAMLDQGWIRLPHAAAFALAPERYLFKRLGAWDDACNLADRIKIITDGRVWYLFGEIKNVLKVAEERPAEMRNAVISAGIESVWIDFCSATPNFQPYKFAGEMIKQHRVFRVPLPSDLPDEDPRRDIGGFVSEATGASGVMNYYDGRMGHVLRLGLCCAFASVGSHFSGA